MGFNSFFCLNKCLKILKKLKKPLEMRKKVVYNGFKWWKVVNSGRKWGESGRPILKRGEFIVNRRI